MLDVSHPYFDSNLSWLSYNHRLLMEASDESVPVLERLRFLGLYMREMDDFRQSKIPMLQALAEASKDVLDKLNIYPTTLLEHISEICNDQLAEFETILEHSILVALKAENVHLYFQEEYSFEHFIFAEQYFTEFVLRYLQPVFLSHKKAFKSALTEGNTHLFVALKRKGLREFEEEFTYATVNIPHQYASRFVEFPSQDGIRYFSFLEDIIKQNINSLFPEYEVHSAYVIEFGKTKSLELEDELSAPLASKLIKQLEKKAFAPIIPIYHETGMPATLKTVLEERLDAGPQTWVELGQYLNYQDFAKFPPLGGNLNYAKQEAIQLLEFDRNTSMFKRLLEGDILLHLPYHSHLPIVKFFNDAAVDPAVKEIHVSLYKISANSFLINSLISAALNGKKVVAFVELNSKFDIHENIQWAKKMKEAGVKVIFSSPGLKVHAKIALIKRKVKKGWERYAYLGTGGFYKLTARELTDHALLTTDSETCNELELLFAYLASGEEPKKFKFLPFSSLLVTQFNAHRRFVELIDREIKNSKMGRNASIIVKINQLQDRQLIDKLYHAARTGVSVTLIVTNCIGVIPDLPTISENITILRMVDRYEENTRIFYFHNAGQEEIFLSSGDWTYRNFQRRIDVCFPILNMKHKNQLKEVLSNYIEDTVKSVKLDVYQNNISLSDEPDGIRAQAANYALVERLEATPLLV